MDIPIVSYVYDETGRRARMKYGNGVVTSYKYHSTGNLASIVTKVPRHDADSNMFKTPPVKEKYWQASIMR